MTKVHQVGKGRNRKIGHVPKISNPILQEQDPKVQNLLMSGAIQTVVQGSVATIEKPKVEVGTNSPIVIVDAVIEKLTSVDPSPPTAPTLLLNPIHTTNMVAMDAINEQPRVQVVHNVKQNVGHDDTVSKPRETLQDPSPSVVKSSILYFPVGILADHVGVGPDVMEML